MVSRAAGFPSLLSTRFSFYPFYYSIFVCRVRSLGGWEPRPPVPWPENVSPPPSSPPAGTPPSDTVRSPRFLVLPPLFPWAKERFKAREGNTKFASFPPFRRFPPLKFLFFDLSVLPLSFLSQKKD